MIKKIATVAAGVFAIVAVSSGSAFAAPSKCVGGKVKNAGKKAAAKLNCLAKAHAKNIFPVDSVCIAKAEVKFSTVVAKAEAKVPNDCGANTGDAAAMESKVDALYSTLDGLAADGLNTCDSAKVKQAGKKVAAKLGCYASAYTKGIGVSNACLAKAESKFSSAVAKAEAKAPCSVPGDFASYEAAIDAAVDDIQLTHGSCADCCANTKLQFTNIVGTGKCGAVTDAANKKIRDVLCGGLYFGGSGDEVPLPSSLPDQNRSVTKLTGCSAKAFGLTGTSAAEAGSVRRCTNAGEANGYPRTGCLFGAPLPVPNPVTSGVSTCVINRITSSATGSGDCSGAASINFDLGSDLYLTGDYLSTETGINPCPICSPGTSTCVGGPNDTAACTPESSDLGDPYPTSHDCPPGEDKFIGTLPIPFALSTGSLSDTAAPGGAPSTSQNVFCGFCRSTTPPNPFRNPPQPCVTSATCTTAPFARCEQKTDGAFGATGGLAKKITAIGAASACLATTPAPGTLASVFCIPPSYNGLVDGAADLPGPGAVTLAGSAQLLP